MAITLPKKHSLSNFIASKGSLYLLFLFFCFFVFAKQAKAEGSKEMLANGGNRAFFLSSTDVTVFNPFPTKGTVKVYAKAGETLYLGSSAVGLGNGRINVRKPGGGTTTYATSNTLGLISTIGQENFGPSLNNGADGGYIPFTVPVGAGEEGIWEIDFIASSNGDTNPAVTTATQQWVQNNTRFIAAFDVSVRNVANTSFVPGRAFLNVFGGNLGDYDSNFYAKFKILTKDGYQYEVDNNGQAGFQFVFFVNNKGFRDGSGNALYKSINTTTSPNVQDPRANDSANDITHKIFFNTPSTDLPSTASTPTGTTWLLTSPLSPTITTPLVTGKEGTDNLAGTYPLGCYINFDINQSGSYILNIDVNKNGIFTDANDVRITGSVNTGHNQIYWNGLNGSGNSVGGSFVLRPQDVKISLVGGEVHFPFLDVENNVNGIIIKRTNGVNAPVDIVYWDDSDITSNNNPSSPKKTSVNGLSSSVNGHKWGKNDYKDNAFGNEVGLDTWAYVISNELATYQDVSLRQADLEVQSISTNKTSYCVGENIVYTVKVKNNGPDAVSAAAFALNFPNGFVVSNVTFSASGGTATLSGGAVNTTAYTASLDMANQAVLTITITGSLSALPFGSTLSSTASIMRPKDVNDPDATNNDDLPPTDPQAECDAGTTGCNNIKTSTSVNISTTNISIASTGITEGNSGTTNITFPVSLSATSNCPITVNYTVTHTTTDPSGYVTNNADFSGATSGTLTIPAGQLTGNIVLKVVGDKIIEQNERFTITLSNPSGGNQIIVASAEGTISNDDTAVITTNKIDGNETGSVPGKFIFNLPAGITADKNIVIKYNLGGTALGLGVDYTDALSGEVTILAGNENATITLGVVDDAVIEGTDNVLLNITELVSEYAAPNGNFLTLNNTASQLNILDNDNATISISSEITLPEGNNGLTSYTYYLTLNKATAKGFTINYATANGTATTADGDYVADAQILNFDGNAGEYKTITINVNGDDKIEGDEKFYLDFSGLSDDFGGRLTVPVTRTSGVITNDDTAGISITKQDGVEALQSAKFIFTLTNNKTANEDVIIPYTLSGSASASGIDYAGGLTGNVTILAGASSAELVLSVVDDNIIEGDESVTITTGTVSSFYGIAVTNSPQTLAIIDNDYGTLSINDVNIDEGNSGTKTLNFTVNLTGTTKTGFNVSYTTQNGTALQGEDFVGVTTPATIGFTNTPNETKTIQVTIKGDTKIEANEYFDVLLGTLANDFGGHLTFADNSGRGTINNDDSGTIGIVPADGNEEGAVAGTFTFKFPTGITSDKPTMVAYQLSGATNGVDYTGSAPIDNIIIPAGSNSATLTLNVVDDAIVEGTETVGISSGSGSVTSDYPITVNNSPQSLAILDNDEAKISIVGPVAVAEGATAETHEVTFTVSLDKATQRAFSVDFTTVEGTASTTDNDYQGNADQLSFLENIAAQTKEIKITINGDGKIEADELFNILMSNISDNFSGRLTFDNTSATAKILNDDSGSITITKQDGAESGTDAQFIFSLPAGVTVNQNITIPYTISGATGDYTGATSGNVVILAGDNEAVITLPIINDTLIEGTESITLTTGTLNNSYGITINNPTISLDILDNDTGTISIADKSIVESDSGSQLMTFTISLSGQTEGGFNIPYATAEGTAKATEDFTAVTAGNIAFFGNLNETKTVSVQINGDTKIEADETFQLILGALSKTFGGQLTIVKGTANATITNNDSSQITIVPQDGSEEGTVPGTFVFKLGPGITSDQPITIAYNLGGNASNTSDYTGALSGTLIIPVNANSYTLSLPVIDDQIVEDTETISLTTGTVTSVYPITVNNSPQSLNIIDNDVATLSISAPTPVLEGALGNNHTVTFSITLDKATNGPFSVAYSFANQTATLADNDYSATGGSLSFTGSIANESRPVSATINGDGKIEANELFDLVLGALSQTFNGRLTITNNTASAEITNDDNGTVSISAQDATEDGTKGFFKFSLPAGVTADKDIVIDYTLSGSSVAADYTLSPSTSSATILAGNNQVVVEVEAFDDDIVEGTETLELNATGISSNGITLQNNSASLNIIDNDVAQITLIGPADKAEGQNGTSGMQFKIKLDKQTALPFTLNYQTQDGTAVAGEDYIAQGTTTLNFSGAKDQEYPITVQVNGDKKVEADEVFNFLLSGLSMNFEGKLTIANGSASAKILNDDSGSIKITKVDAAEPATNGKFIFSFENGASSDKDVTFTYTLGGTAISAVDYTASAATTVTILAGASSAEIAINVIDDNLIENTEIVTMNTLSLISANPGIALTADRPVVNIVDNDAAKISLTGSHQVVEGNGTSTTILTYTVTLDKATNGGFTVNWNAVDGTAKASSDNDYFVNPISLPFSGYAGETHTFTVTINGDDVIEPSENFNLVLTIPTNPFGNKLQVENSPYDVEITNDDGAGVSISRFHGTEGITDGRFTFSLPFGVTNNEDLTFNYILSGGAAVGQDYDATTITGTITLPAMQTSIDLPINVVDDAILELTEDVNIEATIQPNANGVKFVGGLNQATQTLNIYDNDEAQITIDAPSQNESDADNDMVFTLHLNKATSIPFDLPYHTVDDLALAAEDYTAKTDVVHFDGNSATETQEIIIPIKGDKKIEKDEVFKLLLDALPQDFEGRLTLAQTETTGTIVNDDSGIITITKQDGEEGNPIEASYVFSFPNGVFADEDTKINYTLGGTALGNGKDYTANPSPSTITIPAGQSSATLTLNVNDDDIVEYAETVSLDAINVESNYPGVTLDATRPVINIEDNDSAVLTLTGLTTLDEGMSGNTAVTYTLTLDKATSAPFTIKYNTSDGAAKTGDNDYNASSGTLSFTGEANKTQTFTVYVRGDKKIEADEIFNILLTDLSKDFDGSLTYQSTPFPVTIKNDDTSAITITRQDGAEGGANAAYIFSLAPGLTTDEDLVINYTLDNASAKINEDYTVTTGSSGTVTLLAGQNSITLPITIIDDAKVEDVEKIKISATVSPNQHNIALANNNVELTIADNDDALLSIDNIIESEGNSSTRDFTFSVKLNKETQLPFDVNFATADVTALAGEDYTAQTGGILHFTGNVANEVQNIKISINGDVKVEADETFRVILGAISNTFNHRLKLNPTANIGLGTIQNDDNAQITITAINGKEEGPTNGKFRFAFDDGASIDKDVTINYELRGSAVLGQDYTTLNANSVTIPKGENAVEIDLNITDDAIVEGDELVQLNNVVFAPPYTGVTLNSAIPDLTIADNDEAILQLNGPLTISEGDAGVSYLNFKVKLSKATATGFSLDYTTADDVAKTGDNDYVANSGTLSFFGNAGEEKTIQVAVIGDKKIEANEAFKFIVSNLDRNFGGRLKMPLIPSTIATINNDDDAFISISGTDGAETPADDQPVIFRLSLPSEMTADKDITINYTLLPTLTNILDRPALPVVDYIGNAISSITILKGQNSVDLILPVVDDQLIEATEKVEIRLDPITSPYAIGFQNNNPNAVLNILDNDAATLTLSAPIAKNEGDTEDQTYTFNVTLNKATALPFSISYKTVNGAATAEDIDFIADEGYLTFNANEVSTKQINITVKGDRKIEADEDFYVELGTPTLNFINRLQVQGSPAKAVILNDDSPLVSIIAENGEEQNAKPGTFTFKLPDGLSFDQPVKFDYSLQGSAQQSSDYNVSPTYGSVVLLANTNQVSVNINTIDDDLVEGKESVQMQVANIESVYNLPIPAPVSLDILDNDEAKLTLAGPVSVIEGNSGNTTLTFELSLDKATAKNFTIDYGSKNGSATVLDADYQSTSGTLVFNGNTNEKQYINVAVNGDTKIEADEYLEMLLQNLSENIEGRITYTTSPVKGIILDDDNIAANKIITITKIDGEEGLNNASFTFSYPSGITFDTETKITYSLDGEANVGTDYQAPTGTIMIPAGRNNIKLELPVVDDLVIEDVENVAIHVASVSNSNYTGIVISNPETSLNIKDNDRGIITVSPASVLEGNSGTSDLVFAVTLEKATAKTFELTYKTLDKTASIANQDYQTVANKLIFNGEVGEVKTITVPVYGDVNIEKDEILELLLQQLSNDFNGRLTIPSPKAEGTIINDDQHIISVNKTDGAEGGAAVKFTFSFPPNVFADETVQINYQLDGGSALANGEDYNGAITGTIEIPPYQNSVTLTLPVNDDVLVEGNESVVLKVLNINSVYQNNISVSTFIPEAKITDNDQANIRINGPINVTEGNNGTTEATFTVTLDKATSKIFSLDFATQNGSATVEDNDYIPKTGNLNFGGRKDESYAIKVLVNGDLNIEQNEVFKLLLSNLSENFDGNLTINGSPAEGIIVDDDDIDANKKITITAINGSEDGAPVQFKFSFPPQVTSNAATIIPYSLGGSASVSDYSGLSADKVIIPAGSNSVTLTLPVTDDDIIEGDEVLKLTTAEVLNANFIGIKVVNSPAEALILDNDRATLSIGDAIIDEGDSGNKEVAFTVTLNQATGLPFVLNYASANGTATVADADYQAIASTVNFSGYAGETQTIKVQINGDKKIEADETFKMILGSLSKDFGGRLSIPSPQAMGTIKNDDNAQILVTGTNGAEEGKLASTFTFSFPTGYTSDIPTIINYTLGGKATAGNTDYQGLATNVIAIPANQNSITLTLPVIDDEIVEDDETINIAINGINTNYVQNISFNPALPVNLIKDNDATELKISEPLALDEGNNGTQAYTFTLTLGKATGENFTIHYFTADGTAKIADNDYNAVDGTVSFAGNAGESHSVTVLGNGDLKIEANEDFGFNLDNLSNTFSQRLKVPVTALKNIIKNDDSAILTITAVDGTEGAQDGEFAFALPPGVTSDKQIIVNYQLNGTAGNSDYIINPSVSSVTFEPGENRKIVKILVTDDSNVEERETITLNVLNIINPYNNVNVALPIPIVYIFDNDKARLSISQPAAIQEGQSGNKIIKFDITLDHTVSAPFKVSYSTANGSATLADHDYQENGNSLDFSGFAGEKKTISVTVNSDVTIEADEYFMFGINALSTNFDNNLSYADPVEAWLMNDDVAPIAANDAASMQEDTPVTINLVANDFHLEGIDPATISLLANPAHGEITINTNGTVTYLPTLNYFGNDQFTYTVKDTWGRISNAAAVSLTIFPVNDAPVANDDIYYVQKDSSIRANVGLNDVDVDLDVLKFHVINNVSNGVISFFDQNDGTFIYQPASGFRGLDTFTYTITDPSGLKDTANVSLYVQPKVKVSLLAEMNYLLEGDTLAVTATLTDSLYQDVNIVLNFGGSATMDKDYTLSGNYDTMMIPAGQTTTSQKFDINALKDYLKEGDEVVDVSISAADPQAFVVLGTGVSVLIKDFYPEDKTVEDNENGDIQPDPYFSPNNDGLGNEKFVIYNIEKYPDNEVIIYNRWGNEVYTIKGYDNKDNAFKGVANKGVLANKNAPLAEGVYYYIIHTKNANGKPNLNKGYVIIKR